MSRFTLAGPLMLVPLIFEIVAFPVAGVALAIDGEWFLITVGIGVIILVVPFVYVIASIPNMGIAFASAWLLKRRGVAAILGKPLGVLFLILALIYNVALISVIVTSVFSRLPPYAGIVPQEIASGVYGYYGYFDWKTLLWCYAVATAPFFWAAGKVDPNNMGTTVCVLYVQTLALLTFTGLILRWDPFFMGMSFSIWFVVVILILGLLTIQQRRKGPAAPGRLL